MRTVQMTLDEELVDLVDSVVTDLKTTRSAFTRDALREAIQRYRVKQLEEQHRQGYLKHPVEPGEVDIWEDEQVWGDE